MRVVVAVFFLLAGCRQILGLDDPQPVTHDAAHDALAIDAPPDASMCPPGCTSCDLATNVCTIDCALTDCSNNVVCPTGYHCNVKCSTANSCRNGVSCATASDCTIECSGGSSCRNVLCGPGACNINCAGQLSCRGVSCGNSCACDVSCGSTAACEMVTCSSTACTMGLGCTSQPVGCNTCGD